MNRILNTKIKMIDNLHLFSGADKVVGENFILKIVDGKVGYQ